MELTFLCPNCGVVNQVPWLEAAEGGTCRQCQAERGLHRELVEDGQLRGCPWCATEDLYIQKDFPQGLGLVIVIVGFAISTVFWYYERPISRTWYCWRRPARLVLYYRVPDVTICYRCLGQYGVRVEARPFQPFDLAIGERYRQERLRTEELRERGRNIEPTASPRSGTP